MQGAFISAMTYTPPTVLGRRLLPFSSWHGLLLEAAGSVFIERGRADLDELIYAVWVCSHSFADGFQIAGDYKAIRYWGKSIKPGEFKPAERAFRKYMAAALMAPEYWQRDGESATCAAPVWWHAATFARRELHLSEAEAWDYPLARITCHQTVVAEINGNKDLIASEDIKGIAMLKGTG